MRKTLLVITILILSIGFAMAQPSSPHTIYGSVQTYEGSIPPDACIHMEFTFGVHFYDETSPEFNYDETTGNFFLQITDDLFGVGDSIRIEVGDSCLYEDGILAEAFDSGPETPVGLITLNPIEGLRPELIAGYMDPTTGYVTDFYEFGVTYISDPWDREPSIVQVWIDGSLWWNMAWAGSGTPLYTLGEPYIVNIDGHDIGKGTHTYHFYAEDDLGLPVETTPVTFNIMNTAPTAPAVHVEPDLAFTDEDIEVVFDTEADDEDDDALTYFYEWYKDGVLEAGYSGYGENILPFGATEIGESWEVRVYAYDGEEMGPYSYGLTSIIAPTLTDGEVDPETGDRSTVFNYSVTYTNLRDIPPQDVFVVIDDGDPIAMTEARDWTEGVSFEYSTSLDLGEHTYRFEAMDTLGHPAIDDIEEHDGPTVGNNVPEITGVDLTADPDPATERSTLTASAEGWSDADGDPEGYHYEWYVNEAMIAYTDQVLDGDYFARGDEVYCTVIPYDGYDEGTGINTEVITIENALPGAPVFTYEPMPIYDNDNITLIEDVAAVDPDDDDITYHYEWSIEGTVIGDDAAILDASLTEPGDVIHVDIYANDTYGDGEIFSLDIDIDWPTLSDGAVVPVSGAPTETFRYEVTYTSVRNIAPNVIFVQIDGGSFAMTAVDPTDVDYTDGYDYYFETTLPYGEHTYAFHGDDVDGNAALGEEEVRPGPVQENDVPYITDLAIEPLPEATETDTIMVTATGDDEDGEVVTFSYQWYNEIGMIDGATSPTIDGEYFDKGDLVWCEVTPHDPWEAGTAQLTEEVTIINTPPTIDDVELTADPDGWFNELGTLVAVVNADDVDSDELMYDYTWYVNGEEVDPGVLPEGTLDGAFFDRGDTVYFGVTVSDDEEEGESAESDHVVIGNAPPVFDFLTIDPDPAYTTDRLEAVLSVSDPDGDDVDITYNWYVDDVLIADWGEDFVPAHLTRKHQTWKVVVTAEDGMDGETSQDAEVTILNSPPVVDAINDTIVIWNIDYHSNIRAFDVDVDRIIWRMIEGPEGLELDSLTGDLSWTEFDEEESLGVYPVDVIVTDGEEEIAVSFNLNLYPLSDELFAPRNLDALSGYMLSIPMSWDVPLIFGTMEMLPLDFEYYEVQRSTDMTTWETVGTNAGAGFVDATVMEATMYYYRVRAIYGVGNSSWSNVDFATSGTINADMLYSAYTYAAPPVMDGIISEGEWADATELAVGPHKLYVKNTEGTLYLAFVDGSDDVLDADDAFYVEIEDNHNLRWPSAEGSIEGEYRVRAVWDDFEEIMSDEMTYQGIWGVYPGAIGRDERNVYEGLNGAVGGGAESAIVYEMAIPIDNDILSPEAINSEMGNVVGFRFASYDAGTFSWTYTWLSGSPATDPESFGNLMLGIGSGGPRFRVWNRFYEVTLREGETDTRPMWVSNQGNGLIDYHLMESYLPFVEGDERDAAHPILLYTDDQTIGQDALAFLGYGYDVVTEASDFITDLSIEEYEVAVITLLEPMSSAVLGVLESFLIDSGKVIIACPSLDDVSSHTIWATLGMDIMDDLGSSASALNWDMPEHPIFHNPMDVPPSVETVEGTFDDYGDGILSSGATILASHDEIPYPGNGAIVLSRAENAIVNSFVVGDTRDDNDNGMADGVELLVNELYYLAALEDIHWLDVAPDSGQLSSHETDDATLTFDATDLVEGDYEGYIMANSTDPVTPLIMVPCRLHVRAPDYHLVRFAFPPDLRHVMPGQEFEMPIMAAGLMGTEVESITLTVNTNSIVASPMNVVSDDYEVTVLDYNLDEITFRLDYDWYIEDGEICRVQFQVAELAPVAGSSNLEISDVSYNSEARVDETEMVNGRIMVEAGEMDWMVWMEFTTSGMLTDDIYIGANPEATDMYDDALDMLNDPPTSWFDPYSDISGFDPGNPQLDGDIRNSYNDVITWTIPVGDSAGKIEWDFRDEDTLLAMGSLFLNGVIDMKTASVYYFDPGETVTIVYRRTGESPFDIHMYPGWNMVSLPLVPSAMESTPDNVYPDASYVYGFDTATNNWVEAENIVPGVGYMVLVTTEVDYTLWGQPVNDYTFDIIRGWNLIGTVYDEADFSSPTSSPPGAVMGSPEHTYYYNVLGGGYDSGDVLEPGKGYFVAANVDAVLSVPGVAGGKAYLGDMQEEFQLDLTIDGQSYALAIGSSNSNCVRPLPPTIGDMQYAAYLSVNDWQANAAYFEGSSEFDLVVNGRASILVNSKSDNSDAAIVVNGQQIPLQGEINLPCAGSYKIIYGDLPTAFKLYGNVPNPFNATTRIAFDLPTDSEVKLEVFDLLGKKVSSLIDGQVAAGSHSMTWNGLDDSGRETPSGIYYYRIKTDSHEDTRRMLLLK